MSNSIEAYETSVNPSTASHWPASISGHEDGFVVGLRPSVAVTLHGGTAIGPVSSSGRSVSSSGLSESKEHSSLSSNHVPPLSSQSSNVIVEGSFVSSRTSSLSISEISSSDISGSVSEAHPAILQESSRIVRANARLRI